MVKGLLSPIPCKWAALQWNYLILPGSFAIAENEPRCKGKMSSWGLWIQRSKAPPVPPPSPSIPPTLSLHPPFTQNTSSPHTAPFALHLLAVHTGCQAINGHFAGSTSVHCATSGGGLPEGFMGRPYSLLQHPVTASAPLCSLRIGVWIFLKH